jgi:prepilin-type N-terminal cleavage/methylation domain-containing protein
VSRSSSQPIPGFSLIELALVLIIIGIIVGAVFKGQDLLEAARLRAVMNDINTYRTAVFLYQETFNAFPGDDPEATLHFGNSIGHGNGNGIIDGNEATLFWQHLAKAGHISQGVPPTSKIGGKFTVKANPKEGFPGNWLMLGKETGTNEVNDGPLLTPKQAMTLKAKADDGNPAAGTIRIIEGAGVLPGQCVTVDGHLNLLNPNPACILLVQLS